MDPLYIKPFIEFQEQALRMRLAQEEAERAQQTQQINLATLAMQQQAQQQAQQRKLAEQTMLRDLMQQYQAPQMGSPQQQMAFNLGTAQMNQDLMAGRKPNVPQQPIMPGLEGPELWGAVGNKMMEAGYLTPAKELLTMSGKGVSKSKNVALENFLKLKPAVQKQVLANPAMQQALNLTPEMMAGFAPTEEVITDPVAWLVKTQNMDPVAANAFVAKERARAVQTTRPVPFGGEERFGVTAFQVINPTTGEASVVSMGNKGSMKVTPIGGGVIPTSAGQNVAFNQEAGQKVANQKALEAGMTEEAKQKFRLQLVAAQANARMALAKYNQSEANQRFQAKVDEERKKSTLAFAESVRKTAYKTREADQKAQQERPKALAALTDSLRKELASLPESKANSATAKIEAEISSAFSKFSSDLAAGRPSGPAGIQLITKFIRMSDDNAVREGEYARILAAHPLAAELSLRAERILGGDAPPLTLDVAREMLNLAKSVRADAKRMYKEKQDFYASIATSRGIAPDSLWQVTGDKPAPAAKPKKSLDDYYKK